MSEKLEISENNELKEFDDIVDPDEDSYETNPKLIEHFEKIYKLNFLLDAAATLENRKCPDYLDDALYQEWVLYSNELKVLVDIWVNGPHSLNEEFVRRADAQHRKYNINICMLVPANVMSTEYYKELIENETECFVENHPVQPRPVFLKNGKKTKFSSRNAYQIIIWRHTHL